MGQIFKSLTRNQNLTPVADTLNRAAAYYQHENNLKKLTSLGQNFTEELSNIPATKQVQTDNLGIGINPQGRPNAVNLTGTPAQNNFNVSRLKALTTQPVDPSAGQTPLTKEIPMSQNDIRSAIMNKFADYASQLNSIDLSPEEKQNGLQVAQLRMNANLPAGPQFFELSKNARRYMENPNDPMHPVEVASNIIPDDKNPFDPWKNIGEVVNAANRHKIVKQRNILTNETRDFDLGEEYQRPNQSDTSGITVEVSPGYDREELIVPGKLKIQNRQGKNVQSTEYSLDKNGLLNFANDTFNDKDQKFSKWLGGQLEYYKQIPDFNTLGTNFHKYYQQGIFTDQDVSSFKQFMTHYPKFIK